MPQGDAVAAPPGFTDLCARDSAACGVAAATSATQFAANAALLTTSSVGASTVAPRTELLKEEAAEADDLPVLVQLETLTAYKPVIDATFVAVGETRPADDTAVPATQLAQAETLAPAPPRPALLTKAQMGLVNKLNRDVNREVQKANDFDLYGLLEFWSLPRVIDGKMYGDCEDYALEKRRRLIAAGVPAEAMSMAVAVTARGESHAVLVVSFESGDWVLDNLTPWATPWGDLNYRWIERQVAGSSEWKAIG